MMTITEPNSIHQRLNNLVDYFCRGNKTAFGRETDILPGVLASIIGGRLSKPSFELLQKIMTRYPEINGDWLVLGRGAMLRGGTDGLSSVQTIPAARNEELPDIVKREVAEQIAAFIPLDVYKVHNEQLASDRIRHASTWHEEAEAIRKNLGEIDDDQGLIASKLISRLEDIERAISVLQNIKPNANGLDTRVAYRLGLKLRPDFSMPFDGLLWKRLNISEVETEELFKYGGVGDELTAIRSNEIDERTVQKILPRLSAHLLKINPYHTYGTHFPTTS